jgi:hypothetical protein
MTTYVEDAESARVCVRAEPSGSGREFHAMSDTSIHVEVYDVPAQTACFSGG